MIKQFIKSPVYVFIDAENLFYTQKTLGWLIGYEKLMAYFKQECGEVKIFVYKGVDKNNVKQKKFIDMLTAKGFIVRTKPVKVIKDKEGGAKWKGSLDIEMALEMFKLKDKFKTAVLISGDSDFAIVLDELKAHGCRVIVMSTRNHVAVELLQRAKYLDLRKLKKDLQK
jgi:uncharacterized LabA/DUF88 family protein